jgi:hypothetical protein
MTTTTDAALSDQHAANPWQSRQGAGSKSSRSFRENRRVSRRGTRPDPDQARMAKVRRDE